MTALNILLWVIAIAMIAVGLVGTVLPALPGIALIFGGIALAAWIDGFARISGWTVVVLGALAAIAIAADYLSGVLGAKRAGASRLAVVGAAIGVVVGLFAGLVGVVVFPFAGAMIGQFAAQRDLRRAGRVGVATWIGLAVGTAIKVAIAFTMVGVFVIALLL
jgi:uncharacterized protein YqgC (DUF456 family)